MRIQRLVYSLVWWFFPSVFFVSAGLLVTGQISVDAPGEAVIAAIFYFMYSVTVGACVCETQCAWDAASA